MKRKVYVLTIFFGLLISCNDQRNIPACIGQSVIYKDLNLNMPSYQDIYTKGWIYLNEIGTGTSGLIIVSDPTGKIRAFDRNAPHKCPDKNGLYLLEVRNDNIVSPSDGLKWWLTGYPLNHGIPLIEYNVSQSLSGTNVLITN